MHILQARSNEEMLLQVAWLAQFAQLPLSRSKVRSLYSMAWHNNHTLFVHSLGTNVRLTEIQLKSPEDVKNPTWICLSEMQK